MSFSDFRPRGSIPTSSMAPRSSVGTGDFGALGEGLGTLDRMCQRLREKVSEMRRRKVSPAEKAELDVQIRDLREVETRLKTQVCFKQGTQQLGLCVLILIIFPTHLIFSVLLTLRTVGRNGEAS